MFSQPPISAILNPRAGLPRKAWFARTLLREESRKQPLSPGVFGSK
jgi:hypothetical protein